MLNETGEKDDTF